MLDALNEPYDKHVMLPLGSTWHAATIGKAMLGNNIIDDLHRITTSFTSFVQHFDLSLVVFNVIAGGIETMQLRVHNALMNAVWMARLPWQQEACTLGLDIRFVPQTFCTE